MILHGEDDHEGEGGHGGEEGGGHGDEGVGGEAHDEEEEVHWDPQAGYPGPPEAGKVEETYRTTLSGIGYGLSVTLDLQVQWVQTNVAFY